MIGRVGGLVGAIEVLMYRWKVQGIERRIDIEYCNEEEVVVDCIKDSKSRHQVISLFLSRSKSHDANMHKANHQRYTLITCQKPGSPSGSNGNF